MVELGHRITAFGLWWTRYVTITIAVVMLIILSYAIWRERKRRKYRRTDENFKRLFGKDRQEMLDRNRRVCKNCGFKWRDRRVKYRQCPRCLE